MRIAIIVPTADRTRANPQRCLAAVAATTKGLDIDLRVIESSGPGFRFSRSINRGLDESRDADAWVLLNDDAFMDEGWLHAMIDAAAAHPEVGIVGAHLRYPDGRTQFGGGRIVLRPAEFLRIALRHRAPLWALRNLRAHRFAKWPYMFEHYPRVSATNRLDFITGACYLITRACLDKVGKFDEDYPFGAEDIDHSLRAREAGFELALATRATGIHLDHASSAGMSERTKESLRTFERKWPVERIERATRGRLEVYA